MLDKNNLEEVDVPSKKIDLDFNLKQKASFVKKGIHVQNIDNVMLREMLHKKLFTLRNISLTNFICEYLDDRIEVDLQNYRLQDFLLFFLFFLY